MRVLQVSDLHIDINSRLLGVSREILEDDIIRYFKIRDDEFDVIFIVGDISNNMITNIKFLDRIEKSLNKKVLFVPGNHDVYRNTLFNITSTDNYNFYKNSSYNLFDNPYKLTDDFYVVGGLGWYDFSFHIDTLKDINSESSIINHIKEVKQLVWADDKLVNFKKDDRIVFNNELDVYKRTFDNIKKENKKVWLLNHFIPYKEFVLFKKDDEMWNACNAFMGSKYLGELIDEYDNIKYVSFGHTHNRFGKVNFRGKTLICKPLGYVGEWGTNDFINEMYNSTVIIEIT